MGPEKVKQEAAAAVLARIHLVQRHAADVRRCSACARLACSACEGQNGGEPFLCDVCSRVYGREP